MIELDKIKIMLVDDHQMFIDGVKSLLRNEKRFDFVAEANSGEAALEILKNITPHILISDISMPGMSGNELINKVKELNPEIRILVISMHNEADIISDIMMLEAEGYILKNTGKKELSTALQKIADGGTHYSEEVLLSLMHKIKKDKKHDSHIQKLSEREIEIIELICKEFSNEEMAEKLFLSKRTIETHRRNISLKTNTKTVVGLIKFAFRNGMVML